MVGRLLPRYSTAPVVLAAVLFLIALTGVAKGSLPNGRVYEQVSPAEKNGADVISNSQRVRAATSGNAIQFASLTGFADVHGMAVSSDYIAVRGPDGAWLTHGITPPQQPITALESINFALEPRYMGEFSSDLAHGVFLAKSPLTDAPNVAAAVNLYVRDDLLTSGLGTYHLLSDATTPQSLDPSAQPFVAAASSGEVQSDFSHVLFESTRDLTANAVSAGLDQSEPKLYEWVNGTTLLVGILPTSEGGGPTISQAGQGALQKRYTAGTISEDGRRAIFTGPPYSGDHTGGVVYLHDDHGTVATADDTTVRISASERTDCADHNPCIGAPEPDPNNPGGSPPPATFWAASADGAQIFFTTAEQLTNDDGNITTDLYRYDVDASTGHHLTRLSIDNEPSDGSAGDVSGVIGASSNGSYVYFTVSADQLVNGGPTGPTGGPVGGERIFVWHTGVVHEVGAINAGTELDRILGNTRWGADPKWSRVTPDGTHMLFVTQGTSELLSLYGQMEYNHGDSCPKSGFASNECREIYVYDATANGGLGMLKCASCNPTGQAATADADIYTDNSTVGGSRDTSHLSHPLSDDGRYVFFNSGDRLTPDDRNNAGDVYEFDTATDVVSLISAGTGPDDSVFVDASGSGHDVFFTTRDQLRSADVDQSRDLYDARVHGMPDPGVPPTVACAGDDECRAPAVNVSAPSAPPTVAAFGLGDLIEQPGTLAVFSTAPITARQRQVLIDHGKTDVKISVSRPGTVTLSVTARIDGRLHRFQKITRTLEHGSVIRFPLRLNHAAWREFGLHRELRLVLSVAYSQDPTPQTIRIVLKHSHA